MVSLFGNQLIISTQRHVKAYVKHKVFGKHIPKGIGKHIPRGIGKPPLR